MPRVGPSRSLPTLISATCGGPSVWSNWPMRSPSVPGPHCLKPVAAARCSKPPIAFLPTMTLRPSVAERSFPLLNLVEMLGQPCLQSVLYGWRQLQDHLDKTQGLKDFKVTPSIHDNMRPLGTQLLKGDRLARLVRKTRTGLCVGKQMIQTV